MIGGRWEEDREEGCWECIQRKTLSLPELLQSLAMASLPAYILLKKIGFFSLRQQEGESREQKPFRSFSHTNHWNLLHSEQTPLFKQKGHPIPLHQS